MKKFVALYIEETAIQDNNNGDNDDTSVLNTTLIYNRDISNTECKKHKHKIKKWDKKAQKALLHSLHPTPLPFISQETNPQKVYLALYKCFWPQSHSYMFLLFKHTLKMGPNNTVHAYESLVKQATIPIRHQW